MKIHIHLRRPSALAVASLLGATALAGPLAAFGQASPPLYEAPPEVYKPISENDQFRVIQATWKPGQHDTMHAHVGSAAGYRLTDCKLKFTTPDGKTVVSDKQGGEAFFTPATPAHWAENVGPAECRLLLFERK